MKITGIKKAVGEHNNWLNRSPFYRANIMLDTSTGEVWCDCFTSCNEWKEYHDSSIISLSRYMSDQSFWEADITMKNLKKYAEMACKEVA